VDRLPELLGGDVQFSYMALDRIVLNGYIERLQRPENLVYFFHEVVGIKCIEPSVLSKRTEGYRDWVRQYTADREIPVFQAPKGERKEDLVLSYYQRLTASEGVACVLTSMEQGEPSSPTPRGPNPRAAIPTTVSSRHVASSFSTTTSTCWTRSWGR